MSRPTIVCLCGSTRFFDAFQKANYDETMAGKIVLSVGFYGHTPQTVHGETLGCTPEQKLFVDDLHLRKIEMSDEVLVLNVGGYIGTSTGREIIHARKLSKPIRWLENAMPSCAKETRRSMEIVAVREWRRGHITSGEAALKLGLSKQEFYVLSETVPFNDGYPEIFEILRKQEELNTHSAVEKIRQEVVKDAHAESPRTIEPVRQGPLAAMVEGGESILEQKQILAHLENTAVVIREWGAERITAAQAAQKLGISEARFFELVDEESRKE